MQSISIARFSCTLCVLASLAITISSCGGSGSTTGSSGSGSNPQAAEYLYTVEEVNLLVYKVDTGSGNLKLVQTVPLGGNTTLLANNPPVLVSGSTKYMYVINPIGTGINGYTVSSDGTLTAIPGSPFLVPQSINFNPDLQRLMPAPSGRFLYALDIGSDILVSQIDPSSGALTMLSMTPTGGFLPSSSVIDPTGASIYVAEGVAGFTSTGDYAGISGLNVDSASGQVSVMASSPFQLASNSQPCETAIDPSGRFVYTSLVNADAVAGFTRDSSSGTLTAIAGSPFPTSRAASQTCDLAMHPSGKFLYALNLNGHDIAGYSISATGGLAPLQGSPYAAQVTPDVFKSPFTQGPMAVDSSGKFLYVLTTEQYIAVYSINQNSGALSISGSPRATPAPGDSLSFFAID